MTCGWKPANIGGSRFQTARSCEYESNRDNGRYDRWAKMSSSRVAMFLSHIWPHTMPYAIPFSPQFLSVFIISNSNISHCIPFICIYVYNDHILHWGCSSTFLKVFSVADPFSWHFFHEILPAGAVDGFHEPLDSRKWHHWDPWRICSTMWLRWCQQFVSYIYLNHV